MKNNLLCLIDWRRAMKKTILAKDYAEKCLRPPKKFFSWAECYFPIYKWENKTQAICSSNRKSEVCEVVKKRLTKNSQLTFYGAPMYFVWLGVTEKRIELQTYQCYQHIEDGKESFEFSLYNLEYFSKDVGHIKITRSYEGYRYGLSILGVFQGTYSGAYFYDTKESIIKKFSKSCLKYLDMEHLINNFDVLFQLDRIFKYRGIIEYAQKTGMKGIVKEIVGEYIYYGYAKSIKHGDMRVLTFKFLKKHKSFFKNSEKMLANLKYEQFAISTYGTYIEGLENYFKLEDFNLFPEEVKPVRFMKWVVKNQVNGIDYRDYKRNIERLNVAFVGERIVMPQNFQQAHDDAADAYTAIIDEKQISLYEERLKELLKTERTIGQYTFLVPHTLKELREEGKKLNHCVGSYTNRIAEGETSIFFVRDKKNKDKPLYTLEMHKRKIVQLRGTYNAPAPEDAWAEAKEFLTQVDCLGIHY